MAQVFKNEENATKLVQNELAVMNDELKNLKMGSGSTVCSEASTGVVLGSGNFAMDFKGWVLDYSKSRIQGITDDEFETMVSMSFKNETNLVTTMDLLKGMKEEFDKQPTRFVGNM